jgi:hypothetical protein
MTVPRRRRLKDSEGWRRSRRGGGWWRRTVVGRFDAHRRGLTCCEVDCGKGGVVMGRKPAAGVAITARCCSTRIGFPRATIAATRLGVETFKVILPTTRARRGYRVTSKMFLAAWNTGKQARRPLPRLEHGRRVHGTSADSLG